MCKVLMVSGISNKIKEDDLWRFISTMGKFMSKGNSDGLGYAAVDHQGNLFGERWLDNEDAFIKRNSPNADKRMKSFKGFLIPKTVYNSFGKIKPKFSAITLHTRYATCSKDFINTHPFVDFDHDTSLIHNGVISNHNELKRKYNYKNMYSTCDSEVILRDYIYNGVGNNPDKISKVVNNLDGYFACGVLSRDFENRRIMDIFKCEKANLSAGFVKELNAMVFTTSIEDLEKTCKEMQWELIDTYDIKSNSLIRLDAISGEVIEAHDFKPNKVTSEYSLNNPKIKKAKELRKKGYSYTDIKNSWDFVDMSSSEKEYLEENLNKDIEISEDEMLHLIENYDYTFDDFYQNAQGHWFLIEDAKKII